MVYCSHCGDNCPSVKDPDKGYICCAVCGKILQENLLSDETTFYKDSSGQSRRSGHMMKTVEDFSYVSHERTIMKGRDEIQQIVNSLHVGGGDFIIDKAHCFYKIAVDKNFTRGRRTTHVAAACLYIACRQSKKAFLLIDFSDFLQISVYVLGAVFLQLCKVLLLAEHPIVQKLVDPSLFIHRFTERLLGKRNNAVSDTALRIVASMKRDWMQTGRKPSGLCGAALYIAALTHGFDYSKTDIVTVVHVCEATLTKRLIEFENTDSGCLTIEEFLARADEMDQDTDSKQLPKPGEVLCKHKNARAEHFAHGLCRKCYDKFIKISGGLEGGSEPPAFQRAERQRMEAAKKAEEAARNQEKLGEIFDSQASDGENNTITSTQNNNIAKLTWLTSDESGNESLASKVLACVGQKSANESACNGSLDEVGEADNDPESLSDIDDAEVEEYLHNEEEKEYKKIIWEEMNKEYLEELAAKEAAAALEMEAAEQKPKRERRRKRSEDAKNSTPAETPAEATCNMLKQKRLGSKINVDAVGGLYDTQDLDANSKKEEGDDEYGQNIGEDDGDLAIVNFNYDDNDGGDYTFDDYLD